MAGISWLIKTTRSTSIDRLAERLASDGVQDRTVLVSVRRRGIASSPGVLMMRVILRPKRRSGLKMLPTIGAFSIAHGIRKATGVVAWVERPGKGIIDGRVVGNAFSRVQKTATPGPCVILGLEVHCKITSNQLGELLDDSPWPKNTLFVDTRIARDKILESLEWIYSEWERGMDRTLKSRIGPISIARH